MGWSFGHFDYTVFIGVRALPDLGGRGGGAVSFLPKKIT